MNGFGHRYEVIENETKKVISVHRQLKKAAVSITKYKDTERFHIKGSAPHPHAYGRKQTLIYEIRISESKIFIIDKSDGSIAQIFD